MAPYVWFFAWPELLLGVAIGSTATLLVLRLAQRFERQPEDEPLAARKT